jgi:hypothetical protein
VLPNQKNKHKNIIENGGREGQRERENEYVASAGICTSVIITEFLRRLDVLMEKGLLLRWQVGLDGLCRPLRPDICDGIHIVRGCP